MYEIYREKKVNNPKWAQATLVCIYATAVVFSVQVQQRRSVSIKEE